MIVNDITLLEELSLGREFDFWLTTFLEIWGLQSSVTAALVGKGYGERSYHIFLFGA
jgi:hypothetical protein